MKIITKNVLRLFYLLLISICLFGCQQQTKNSEACLKYSTEDYSEMKTDTALAKAAAVGHERMLDKFGETSVKGLNYEAYHLLFYSSHGYGQSVKFENKNGAYSLTVKCLNNEGGMLDECQDYQTTIRSEEWTEFEDIIYEFDYWTEEDFRNNMYVLDGYYFILEGNRPAAKNCDKKSYKLVARGSPRYDKIGALCYDILSYEGQLRFSYEQEGLFD